jgi:hypothetical protein
MYTCKIKQLMDYNQSHITTSSEYSIILQQQTLAKEITTIIKQQKEGGGERIRGPSELLII